MGKLKKFKIKYKSYTLDKLIEEKILHNIANKKDITILKWVMKTYKIDDEFVQKIIPGAPLIKRARNVKKKKPLIEIKSDSVDELDDSFFEMTCRIENVYDSEEGELREYGYQTPPPKIAWNESLNGTKWFSGTIPSRPQTYSTCEKA